MLEKPDVPKKKRSIALDIGTAALFFVIAFFVFVVWRSKVIATDQFNVDLVAYNNAVSSYDII